MNGQATSAQNGSTAEIVAEQRLRTIADALAEVPEGATVAIGGRADSRRPLALVRELVRQGRRPGRVLARQAGPEGGLLGVPLEVVPGPRPLEADVVLLHADAASLGGDVLLADDPDAWFEDRATARAGGRVIVSVEQVVSLATVADRPRDLLLRGAEVLAVVHAPFGAHPLGFPGRYPADPARAGVPAAADHWQYLDAVGFARLVRRSTLPLTPEGAK